ncbi:hypothetical protein H4R34_004986 [Dimargaris verticillata]|uniref:Peptidase S8/S53 domain-containing protein n=1 Tax=Dimargaris verticillata TaxID=2761393 RepID=A0A9W8AZM4_9FUNG|nr:hypothetical protein H4R34_004986 [Dimargaris verticillata]
MEACQGTQTTFAEAIVLVARGTCDFQVKIQNAMAQGAGGVIIMDNADDTAAFGIALQQTFDIPVTTVTKATGEKILSLLGGQTNVQVSASSGLSLVDNPTGGQISSFSSYGPSYTMDIKPEVMAPGGSIFSTLAQADGLYGTMSGTSMATPFIAGCIALLMEAGVERNPEYIKQLLMSTADQVSANHGTELATVAHQGAGLVNVVKALNAMHQVSPSKLALLDPAKGGFADDKVTKEITVTNRGSASVTYDLTAVSALSVTSFNATQHMTTPVFGGQGPQVQLNPAQVTVDAGQSVKVNVEITQPSAATQANLVYSGFVQGKVSGQTEVAWSIPLMGLNSDYSSLPFFTPTEAPNPGVYSLTTKKPVTANNVETFSMANRNFPVFSMQVQFPISSWEWYVAEEASPDQVFLTIESGAAFVRDFVGKSQPAMYAWTGVGTDQNGVNITAPDGNYMFVLSYTTPLGDPAKSEDKLSWKSPVFAVKRG